MLSVTARFPLGVYYALSEESFSDAEWPPHPVRLIGALIAANRQTAVVEREDGDAVLQRICEQAPPHIVAPDAVAVQVSSAAEMIDGETTLAEIRGAARWAPRNHELSELKEKKANKQTKIAELKNFSVKDFSRGQAEVYKSGIVVGDNKISFVWPDCELAADELRTLKLLIAEVTFLGTSRSPVQLTVNTTPISAPAKRTWIPAKGHVLNGRSVRAPSSQLITDFERKFEFSQGSAIRTSSSSTHVPAVSVGQTVIYELDADRDQHCSSQPFKPKYWGETIILALDTRPPNIETGKRGSDIRPKISAGYLVSRAIRQALLNEFDEVGTKGEAPEMLTQRGNNHHMAIVPLPYVTTRGERFDQLPDESASFSKDHLPRRCNVSVSSSGRGNGIIFGVAFVLPHESIVADVNSQRIRLEKVLRRLVEQGEGSDNRLVVKIPGAGNICFKTQHIGEKVPYTLQESRYTAASYVWDTVTPVVHSHMRRNSRPEAAFEQVAIDCAHAGLPIPSRIEVLTKAPLAGSPDHLIAKERLPQKWRGLLNGPRGHLRIFFDQPVAGPIILGKARFYGVGLCVPSTAKSRGKALDKELIDDLSLRMRDK